LDEEGVVDLGYHSRINSLQDIKLNPKTGKPASEDKIHPFSWDLLSKKLKQPLTMVHLLCLAWLSISILKKEI